MSAINFNFPNTATLNGMAPPALPGGAFGPAALPVGLAGAGIYLIVNTFTNNRYAGISNNLANRFQGRMETITECGFAPAQMAQIEVFWGTASYQNTAGFGGVLVHPVEPLPAYGAPLNFAVDGVAVQFERLLIRFLLTQLGAGGTVSNNALAFAPYVNPTPNPVTVNFTSGASPTFAPFMGAAVWLVGGFGW